MEAVPRDQPVLGFEDLHDEDHEGRELKVEGELPDWLEGTLVRNGPARWQVGRDRMRHWFDGQAMLHAFRVGQGEVRYSNRLLDTESRRRADREGGLSSREFATDPCRSIFQRVHSLFDPTATLTDNANVSVQRLGDRMIAMTETPMPISFDPETLAAMGTAYEAPGLTSTAHPHRDRADGSLINFATHFGPRSSYRIFRVDPETGASRVLSEVPVREPAYMHSFAVTESYVILTEFPLVVNPVRLGTSRRPFIENFRWKPERGTVFTVVDRSSGELVDRIKGPPFFAFHHVNAFERDGKILIDICVYEDARVIRELYLAPLRDRISAGCDVFSAVPKLNRYELDLTRGSVSGGPVSGAAIELPVVNHAAVRERPYRYAWGVGCFRRGGWFNELVQINVEDGTHLAWLEPNSYPGEPVFVRRPGATGEADGVLLTVVLSGAGSSLYVIDAFSMESLARAEVGHPIPYGFHGLFSSSLPA